MAYRYMSFKKFKRPPKKLLLLLLRPVTSVLYFIRYTIAIMYIQVLYTVYVLYSILVSATCICTVQK